MTGAESRPLHNGFSEQFYGRLGRGNGFLSSVAVRKRMELNEFDKKDSIYGLCHLNCSFFY